MKRITHQFHYGSHEVVLETGLVARQADSAVMIQVEDTLLLVTVVLGKESKADQRFLPLCVHYQERSYAAGKFPGGFFKREGRQTEGEILVSRLIDRSIRPLFSRHLFREIQIIVSVLSADPQVHPDIVALLGVSAALSLTDVPFDGPVAACRLAKLGSHFVLNPSTDQRKESQLDLVVACNHAGLIMVEALAHDFPEVEMVAAMEQAYQQQLPVLQELNQFAEKAKAVRIAAPSGQFEEVEASFERSKAVEASIASQIGHRVSEIYEISDSTLRIQAFAALKSDLFSTSGTALKSGESYSQEERLDAFHAIEKKALRQNLIGTRRRVDGRAPEGIRSLDIRAGFLPRTHGSSLFTRGRTQALATVTLGGDRDARLVEDLVGSRTESFLLHYNFLPFCVGEVGPVGAPKRREIGHGTLAKRAFASVLPAPECFPHSIRVVSEITESDGSSSMATVCAASLALMDAGVPIRAAVAGVAMGLVCHPDGVIILSDINALEDRIGDMDFKVAGTKQGITALQMDVKVPGIQAAVLHQALIQAKQARLHILSAMDQVLAEAASELSASAPKVRQVQIPTKKIKDLVGKGGCVIRKLTEEFNARIDVSDSGLVRFSTALDAQATGLEERIKALVAELELGAVYSGKVTRIETFGAFVTLEGVGKSGLVHISEISSEKFSSVNDCLSIGDAVQVRVLAVDPRTHRLRLSMKGLFTLPIHQNVVAEAESDQLSQASTAAEECSTSEDETESNSEYIV